MTVEELGVEVGVGQVVEHVHFHIIPRMGEDGLGIGWPAGSLDGDTAAALLEKIQAAL